jgi:peptide chain release factor 2
MRRLAEINRVIEKWRGLEKRVKDISEMVSLAEEDALFREEYETEIDSVSSYLDELELEMALSGEYDSRNAILAIHAGAGGTESQDWAEMLQRMYLRWAERRSYKTDILDTSPGDEAGIKSSTISISGEYAFTI